MEPGLWHRSKESADGAFSSVTKRLGSNPEIGLEPGPQSRG